MKRTRRLGELQLAILQVLWSQGESTASEVHAALEPQRGLAPTTISTMLRKMEDKGVLTHRTRGRQFVYRATVAEEDVRRHMVADLVERLFEGDPLELVSHLLDRNDLDPTELRRVRKLLEERRGRKRRSGA